MSLMLKGIDLPTEGDDITLEINHKGEVRAYSTELKETDTDTKAIQIPKNHGNLKDENEIKKNSIDDGYDLYVSWTDIDNAPTILEAEE